MKRQFRILEGNPYWIALGGTVLFLMVWNGIWADWSQGLLATTYGPLYPGVHALSVLSVCVASFFVVWKIQSVSLAALVGLSIVAIHELIWAGLSLFYYGINQVAGDNYIIIYLGIIALFLRSGRKHLRPMLWSMSGGLAYYSFGVNFLTPYLPIASTGYAVAAITGWVISCVPWFFVKRNEDISHSSIQAR